MAKFTHPHNLIWACYAVYVWYPTLNSKLKLSSFQCQLFYKVCCHYLFTDNIMYCSTGQILNFCLIFNFNLTWIWLFTCSWMPRDLWTILRPHYILPSRMKMIKPWEFCLLNCMEPTTNVKTVLQALPVSWDQRELDGEFSWLKGFSFFSFFSFSLKKKHSAPVSHANWCNMTFTAGKFSLQLVISSPLQLVISSPLQLVISSPLYSW